MMGITVIFFEEIEISYLKETNIGFKYNPL